MSKRKRNNRARPRVAWPLLAFGGILLVAAAILFATQGSRGSAGGGPARAVVEPAKIDYGYVKFGTNETFKIKVTNAGDGVLRFNEKPYIEVLEGC